MVNQLIKKVYREIKYFSSSGLICKILNFKHIIYGSLENGFYPLKGSVIDFHRNSKLLINAILFVNNNKLPKSKAEVLIQLCKSSKFIINGNFSIGYGSDILLKENATLILNGGYCNSNVEIRCGNKITIGKNCAIARNVKILDSDFHSIYDENSKCVNYSKPIDIGDNVWIGTGATILKGVAIGNGAVIGADSVVTKDVPANSIVAGNPATIVRRNINWVLETPMSINDDCTGCGACYNVCPKNAISMIQNDKGFYNPQIDKEKCINCGLCEKVCPLNNYESNNNSNPTVYAVQNKDDEQRYKSASGGAFPLFAKYVINQGGVVFGVIWDENIVACHTKAETIEELEKMYSSKYVQSNTKATFKEAKEFLEKGRLVLYSGTPCQIAGLKSFLRKDYENLITIDLVCHGAQSPLFLEKYKQDFLKKKQNEKILNINLRSKLNGWGGYFTTTTTTKGIYQIPKDYYTDAMDLTLNECCLSCKFTGVPRIADITIGDFWGIDEFDKTLNDKKGTSIVLLNNTNGINLFENVKNNCLFHHVPIEIAIKRNPNILHPTKKHIKRKEFLQTMLITKNIKRLSMRYTAPPLHIKLYRLLPQFMKDFIKYKIMKMEQKN